MKHEIIRQFGNNVRELRKAKGWSQEELAKKSGLHRTYIGGIERYGRNVSLINVSKIAKALGISAETLIQK